jgi:hypothetical protein
LRACGARPSARWPARGKWPCGGRSGNDAKGDFLGGARSPRPHGTAARMARHCVATGAFPRSRWPRRGNVGVSVMLSFRACGARPSAGAIQARMASRGKPGADAEGDFLGGARSPRPRGKALLMPKAQHNYRGETNAWWPNGACSGEANSVRAGVRSPPLREG